MSYGGHTRGAPPTHTDRLPSGYRDACIAPGCGSLATHRYATPNGFHVYAYCPTHYARAIETPAQRREREEAEARAREVVAADRARRVEELRRLAEDPTERLFDHLIDLVDDGQFAAAEALLPQFQAEDLEEAKEEIAYGKRLQARQG